MEHYFPVRAPEKLEHDMFGAYIEKKLGSIPMVPFVQKIINDAIFLGEMQSLNLSSRIVTDNQNVISKRSRNT